MGLSAPRPSGNPQLSDAASEAKLHWLMGSVRPQPNPRLRQHNKEDPQAGAKVKVSLLKDYPYSFETFRHPAKPFPRRGRESLRLDGSKTTPFFTDVPRPQTAEAPRSRESAAHCPATRATHPLLQVSSAAAAGRPVWPHAIATEAE